MVKSLISEALARHEAERKVDPAISSAGPTIPLNPTDEELARLAEQLKVNIKIVGCSGLRFTKSNKCHTCIFHDSL